jgi:MoxR-like ATPase
MAILLNYNDMKKAVRLTLLADDYRVPMIMGDRGCGKTALAKDLARELDANFIVVDANTLKEGEIGGIPSIRKYKDAEGKIHQICDYATHVKLQECTNYYDEDNEKLTILFIDEFNRCDSIVKRELMNLVLNREINGYCLPENVHIICACNPSSDFSDYNESDYQVEDMEQSIFIQ